MQATGPPGQAILLKTENGQFQLLRVGPSPVGPGQQNLANPNQTIRLQTVPAVSRFTGPPLALRKTIVTQQQVKAKANVNENQLKFDILLIFTKYLNVQFTSLKFFFCFLIVFIFRWNEYTSTVLDVVYHFN